MQKMMNNPRQKDPFEEDVQELANAGKVLFRNIRNIFSSKEDAKVSGPTFSKVGDMLVDNSIAFNINVFNDLYKQVPDSLCKTYNEVLDEFRMSLPNNGCGPLTYEEIIKQYMEFAADVSILSTADTINGMFLEIIDFFCDISIPMPNLEDVTLSLIWASMIYDLEAKKSSSPCDSEKNRIAKMCIGLLGLVSQIAHREVPYWKWIGKVYKIFAQAGDYIKESPYLYNKLHESLYKNLYKPIFPDIDIDIRIFPNWHKNLEKYISREDIITIGKAFNICYTFRVGDIYLHSVLNSLSFFSEDLKNRLIDALSPIPKDRDLIRIFDLYTKPSIY